MVKAKLRQVTGSRTRAEGVAVHAAHVFHSLTDALAKSQLCIFDQVCPAAILHHMYCLLKRLSLDVCTALQATPAAEPDAWSDAAKRQLQYDMAPNSRPEEETPVPSTSGDAALHCLQNIRWSACSRRSAGCLTSLLRACTVSRAEIQISHCVAHLYKGRASLFQPRLSDAQPRQQKTGMSQ